MLEMQARTKGLDFLIEIDKQLPPTLFTDPTRLKQCLINLIGNAVKFTDSGHVALRIVADNRAEQPCVRFDVEDTGIGIAPDKQEVIFKSFSQADISTSRQYGGTGLGLTITRQLAGLLGGDIRLTSEPGRGSTFSLTLPLFVPKPAENGLAAVGRRARQRTTDAGACRGRILLAEKTFPSQLTLTLMMRRIGLDVQLASSAGQLLQAIEQEAFDLIFLDEGLGAGRDLETLLYTIRYQMPQTPIIAVCERDSEQNQHWQQRGSMRLTRPLSRAALQVIDQYPPSAANSVSLFCHRAGYCVGRVALDCRSANGAREVLLHWIWNCWHDLGLVLRNRADHRPDGTDRTGQRHATGQGHGDSS